MRWLIRASPLSPSWPLTVDLADDDGSTSLSAWAARDSTGGADDVLSKVSVITWRGMMTKLMLAVYEAENAAKGRRVDGWEMNAMVLDVRCARPPIDESIASSSPS